MAHPRYLYPVLTSRDLSEWMAYSDLEPFGPLREDLRAGVITAMVANAVRDPKKRREPFGPADFFASLEERDPETLRGPRRRQTWEEQLHVVEMLNAALGGRDLR